ncbi:venom serine carboxypeptidase-like [Rhopalosiphum maidis]|uniref:venom serine carboxypeptidase-like n=1 Tax=Rhopalosiphum maidis TaxID=43146 RepID=UPI000F003C74|nr:venom serine carboxypeptidase-like [Rhopalosiphum maidis]
MGCKRQMLLWSATSQFIVPAVALFLALRCCGCSTPICDVHEDHHDDGPLYLSPMIRDGRIDEARAACKVRLNDSAAAGVDSCAGYLTVDEAHDSNLFFWFFPAASGDGKAPVVLWLQGGPGAPSLYSVFNENGPFLVDEVGGLLRRNLTWTSTHSMLYVDSPVGVGYSFTGDEAGYTTNQTAIAKNLYAALVQFFELYPEYRDNDFYAAGESYAGKYVPAVSYAIHRNNDGARVKINLKGLAIGNGFIDPVNQMVYSDVLFQYGLIDEDGKRLFKEQEDLARDRIASGDYKAAYDAMTRMMITTPSLYGELTGMRNIYNMMWHKNPIPYEGGHWDRYVQCQGRAALHVGRRPWSSVDVVYERMKYDIPLSVAPWLAELLDTGRYRVLLYSGQLDVIVPYRGTVNVARALRWAGAERFRNATRSIWMPNCSSRCRTTKVAGYATTHGPLTVLLVRNAGHMVPYDQPAWAHNMIELFTSGESFH